MSIDVPIFAVAFIVATIIASILLFARRDSDVRASAEKIIADSGTDVGASGQYTETIAFRKSRLRGALFLLAALLILSTALYGLRFNLGTLNRAGIPFTPFSAAVEALF